MSGVGQRYRKASSGADFGLWHLSARGNTPSGKVSISQEAYGCQEMRRTILVGAIHPPASPTIGQICRVLCMQVDEQRTGMLNPTHTCPRVLAQHPTLLPLAGWVGVPELVTDCCIR